MITLPKRLDRPRSGIARAPRREWRRHRAFLRSFQCVVPDCPCTPIEVAHVRISDGPLSGAGVGIKPHDAFAVPMCVHHHRQSHQVGTVTFEKIHRIDLMNLAREFTTRSPDVAMRLAMREAGL